MTNIQSTAHDHPVDLSHRLNVKICGLTTLSDARWAWECGADLLGFIFVPSSPRYITPTQAMEIIAALNAINCQARYVGVFADTPQALIRETVRACGLHLVQLHGHETPQYAQTLGLPAIVARRVRDHVPWEELAAYKAWAYLLDSYVPQRLGGTGCAWRWDLLGPSATSTNREMRPGRLIIAGGLTPENVALAVRHTRPWGVDVASGVEAYPGRQDPHQVRRFIERAKEAEEG